MKNDLTGNKFGRWTVMRRDLDRATVLKSKGRYWECMCDCGAVRVVLQYNLTRGMSTSCGCYNMENLKKATTFHGLSKHPLHSIWRGMISRCYNKKNPRYSYYGGRGILICEEWKNNFVNFYNWGIANNWQKDLQIDRIDNDGNYEPSNCRCVDRKTQCRNRRNNRIITCRGMTMTLAAFAELVGEKSDIIHERMRRGWSEEAAIFTPFKRNKK